MSMFPPYSFFPQPPHANPCHHPSQRQPNTSSYQPYLYFGTCKIHRRHHQPMHVYSYFVSYHPTTSFHTTPPLSNQPISQLPTPRRQELFILALQDTARHIILTRYLGTYNDTSDYLLDILFLRLSIYLHLASLIVMVFSLGAVDTVLARTRQKGKVMVIPAISQSHGLRDQANHV